MLAILLSEWEFHKKNKKMNKLKKQQQQQWEAFFQWQLLKMLNQIDLKTRLVFLQERADPDWANTSIKPFQHTSRRKKALTL